MARLTINCLRTGLEAEPGRLSAFTLEREVMWTVVKKLNKKGPDFCRALEISCVARACSRWGSKSEPAQRRQRPHSPNTLHPDLGWSSRR